MLLETFAANLRYAARNSYNAPTVIGGGHYTRAELLQVAETIANPCSAFLGYCEARRLTATCAADAEFWQRLAGSVRKAGTL